MSNYPANATVVHVPIPADLHTELKKIAAEKGSTMRAIILAAVEEVVSGEPITPARDPRRRAL